MTEQIPAQSAGRIAHSIELTKVEVEWLSAAARRASEDTIVPGAAEQLRALAEKLRWPD